MGCMNEEEQEDEILALSEILPPSTLTVERLGPASHSGTLQVLKFRIRICSTTKKNQVLFLTVSRIMYFKVRIRIHYCLVWTRRPVK
jgi:hypothetical protein